MGLKTDLRAQCSADQDQDQLDGLALAAELGVAPSRGGKGRQWERSAQRAQKSRAKRSRAEQSTATYDPSPALLKA